MISCVPSGRKRTTPPRESADHSVPSFSARMHSGRCSPSPMYFNWDASMPKSRIGFVIRIALQKVRGPRPAAAVFGSSGLDDNRVIASAEHLPDLLGALD